MTGTRNTGPKAPRMLATLKAIGTGSARHADELASLLGWPIVAARKSMDNAKSAGYVEPTGIRQGGRALLRLTPMGLVKLGDLDPQGGIGNERIAEQALVLIDNTAVGMDSGALGHALGVGPGDVQRALAPHVASMRLVHCDVVRQGDRFILYRNSAGSAGMVSAWKRNQATGISCGYQQHPDEQREPAATCAPAAPDQAVPAVADEVVSPHAPAPEPAVRAVPFAGTLDIDAADRKAAARRGEPDPAEAFSCALWNNGTLVISLAGERLTLQPVQAGTLRRYLAHFNTGDQVVPAGGAAP